MTPFDWASLSLNGLELPPPTVGGSPLTSGGQVALLSGGGVAVDCASDTFVVTTVTNAAMIGTTERKGNSFRVADLLVNVQSPLSVPTGSGHLVCDVANINPMSSNGSAIGEMSSPRSTQ
jgi:hypothetical protein